jgi:small subunit ribosomal protein S20e
MAAVPTGNEKKEAVEAQPSQRIRLAITFSKLANLQKVCGALTMKLQKKGLRLRGPVQMPPPPNHHPSRPMW